MICRNVCQLGFLIGLTVKHFILRLCKGHAHFIVVHLAEVIQIHAGDDAVVLIQIAFGVQIALNLRCNAVINTGSRSQNDGFLLPSAMFIPPILRCAEKRTKTIYKTSSTSAIRIMQKKRLLPVALEEAD